MISMIISSKVDLIAFSVTTDTYNWACSLSKEIKRRADKSIIFGGIHVTAMPEEVLGKVDSILPFILTYYPGTTVSNRRCPDYIKGGRRMRPNSADNIFFQISYLFYLSCLLPSKVLRFITAKKIYRIFPKYGLVSIIRLLVSLKNAIKYRRFHIRFSFAGRFRFYFDYILCRMPDPLIIENMRGVFIRKNIVGG